MISPRSSSGGACTSGVDPSDDPTGVRLDHLRAVAKVNFVTVVVRRIVARRDHDACARAQMADGEGKLRRRARSVEDAGVAAVFRRDLGRELREIRREEARVVRDDQLRPAAQLFADKPDRANSRPGPESRD